MLNMYKGSCFSNSREGSLKVSDRILTINDFNVVTLNLAEVYMLLSQCDNQTTFTMEYDISVIGKLSFYMLQFGIKPRRP